MYKRIFSLFLLTFFTGQLTLFSQTFQEHPHPFYYTEKRIATARENINSHEWAKTLFQEMKAFADEAAEKSDKELGNWFSEYTPMAECDCPYCGHDWNDYTWTWSKEEPDQLKCKYCKKITSLQHFPENDVIYIYDLKGNIHPHPVYRDSTGKKYPIRELLFYHKERMAYTWIENLGIAYAVTGKKIYAEKALVLLKRMAEVYPGFGVHDNFRFERYPFGWAGKLRNWHYTDAYTLQDCAATYDAIYHSGVLKDKDKEFVETNLFQDGLDFLTSVKPSQGISNDIAFRYAGVAMLGRTLEDHDAIAWVLDPNEGYLAFIDKLFYDDGTWLERSLGYHKMAARPLHETVEILKGYSDPKSYKSADRFENIDLTGTKKLGAIFSISMEMRYPDGTFPVINDNRMGGKPDPVPLEALYNWTGNIKWLEKANQAYEGDLLQKGDTYALFNRDPEIIEKIKNVTPGTGIPDVSRHYPGMGLTMLRRGTGKDQAVFTMHCHKYTSPHTHYDALSTTLFANGREMLSDFGYPSFNSEFRMTWYVKTLSHNTLSVDTNNQLAPYSVHNWLYHGNMFSACEGEAWEAYRFTCEPYFRQIALIDADEKGHVYAVDIFRAKGGSIHDWALHGEGDEFEIESLKLKPVDGLNGCEYAYNQLTDVKMTQSLSPWKAKWSWKDGAALSCYFPKIVDCEIYQALTPGERLKSMHGRKKYSIFNRRKGQDLRSEFISIYEPHTGEPLVNKVEKIFVSKDKDWAIVLKVYFKDSIHYILNSYLDVSPQQEPFVDGNVEINWKSRFGVVKVKNNKIVKQEWIKGDMEGFRHYF